MTTKEAAKYLGISKFYLRNLRHELHLHSGPPFTKVRHRCGIACQYKKEDLDAWKAQHSWRKSTMRDLRA